MQFDHRCPNVCILLYVLEQKMSRLSKYDIKHKPFCLKNKLYLRFQYFIFQSIYLVLHRTSVYKDSTIKRYRLKICAVADQFSME